MKTITKPVILLMSFLLLFTALVFTGAGAESAKKATKGKEYPPAIEFPANLPWLNVSRPLTLEDLRGKVVILDFWTYGCINCIHVLEDLHKLEQKFGNKLVVIGVHTPKFDNEKNLETLRRIVVRYGIEHPVVNDVDSWLGARYGMRAWPTQYVIDPAGGVLGKVEGEDNYDVLEKAVETLLKRHAAILDDKPLPYKTEKQFFANSLLAAPGKIAAGSGKVAISDTLHHRIIIANQQGGIERIIGGKESGFVDGAANKARFFSPQGLAFSGNRLYVADTGNHAIRLVNLKNGAVKTVAGNGKNEIHQGKNLDALSIGLRSPWALALHDDQLYIAMAGLHQIWRMDTRAGKISDWAGTGRESINDGKVSRATFSQPSGLSLLGNKLYVADAEVSAVREIDLRNNRVKTLAGSGLFDFGDRDGAFKQAELQHVLGVAALDANKVYIADTYNHKVKLLDLKQKKVTTVVGAGKPGKGQGNALTAALNEPGGLTVFGKTLLIADTNNNRIMQYDPARKTLSEWKLSQ